MGDETLIRVIASVPQITFEQIEIAMPEHLFEHGGEDAQAEFVWDHLSSVEQNWCPQGLDGFKGALDVGYSSIKRKV